MNIEVIPDGWKEGDWNRILKGIEEKKCVPIIGPSLSLVKVDSELSDKSVEYVDMYAAFLEHCNNVNSEKPPASSIDELYFRYMQETNNSLDFVSDFSIFCSKQDFYTQPIEDLLYGWEFPAVINLCPSGIVEQALDNIGKPYVQVNTSLKEGLANLRVVGTDDNIFLINVFGTLSGNADSFALATHQQLRYLVKLAGEGTVNCLPRSPSDYRFLGVGCQTNDWLGRLLIHWLSRGRTVREVNVSSIDSPDNMDERFEQYTSLGGVGFKFIRSDPIMFTKHFRDYNNVNVLNGTDVVSSNNGKVLNENISLKTFFSFIGDPDREVVELFYSQYVKNILDSGMDPESVFIDKNLVAGDAGMQEIDRILNLSERFVVFISLSAMSNVHKNLHSSDAFREWKKIKKRLTGLGDISGLLNIVFIYDRDPKGEHIQLKDLLSQKYDDPEGVYERFFLSADAQPQVIYFPRSPKMAYPQAYACEALLSSIIKSIPD